MAQAAGLNFVSHVHLIMGSLSAKMANKATREKVIATLNIIEMAGGPDALKAIKQKIPAYASMQ